MFLINSKHYGFGFSDILPEGICGILPESNVPIIPKRAKKLKTIKRKKRKKLTANSIDLAQQFFLSTNTDKPTVFNEIPESFIEEAHPLEDLHFPEIHIDYDNINKGREFVEKFSPTNAITVSDNILKDITSITDIRTKELAQRLLTSIVPTVLSYGNAVAYVQAIMRDSFNVELEPDISIVEALREITKIEVIDFAVKNMDIDQPLKDLIMSKFIEHHMPLSVTQMSKVERNQAFSKNMSNLQAVIGRRSEEGSRVYTKGSGEHHV